MVENESKLTLVVFAENDEINMLKTTNATKEKSQKTHKINADEFS